LRKKTFRISDDVNISEITCNMRLTLKKAGGIGLAGPQVGLLKSIFIIDTSPLKDDGIDVLENIYINPEIFDSSDEYLNFSESCLSIPGIYEDVLRPEKIHVRYEDENYIVRDEILYGLTARIFQHEFDHLMGILFIDKINPLRRKMLGGKLNEIAKDYLK